MAEYPAVRSVGFHTDHNELQLEERLQSIVDYHNSQATNIKQLISHNYFTVTVIDPPSKSLALLQDLHRSAVATLICETPTAQKHSMPIPIAPQAFGTGPEQRWAGLSPAEIRAGPIREESDVHQAEKEIEAKVIRRRISMNVKNGRAYFARD
ncbi:hypothetical protein BU23DRAFT_558783 [Bimuria novae-zelandiae CBS 107.79]|uniref:Uncharacterized protein n=1 Tax=Bimuria novae-zelandiae CBS 107.79 TaxID=1447943 RepID=A0A6A5UTD5_9PLEO|nr:hypothetical protein BU23DRAFT_558783 [Bimuria novae-zelandiae CBS 107.79]